MARTISAKALDDRIAEHEGKLRKLKERCDKVSEELDTLYAKKKAIEVQEMIDAIELSSRTKAEILAFLESTN